MATTAEIAEAAKAAGNAAFKAGNFDEAVQKFTEAIEADPTNHVLYSNRSGAYASKLEFTKALLDANKCIELKSDWGKGHSRRGAAYVGLRNLPQAQSAYEKGLEVDPSSAVMKAELEKVKASRSANKQPTDSFAYHGGAGGFAHAPAPPSTSRLATLFSSMTIGFGFFYIIPLFPRYALLGYRASVASILALFVTNLLSAFPIRLATLTDDGFKARQESQGMMVAIFMTVTPPMPFALMPFFALALHNVCHALKHSAPKLPSFVGSRVAYVASEEGSLHVQSFGAISEVVVAAMSPLLVLLHGMRMGFLAFIYFQYVVRRYRTNLMTKQAVGIFAEKIDSLAAHRWCPPPLRAVPRGLKKLVAGMASTLVK